MPTITIGGRAGNTFAGMQDALLISDFPTNNYSAESASQGYDFLLRPDLSGIPGGSVVTDAFWTVGINSGGGSPVAVTVRKVLRAWIEAEASYTNWSTGNAWTTPGALGDATDRASATSCSLSYPGSFDTADVVSTGNTQLIADLNAFIGGATNNGFAFDASPGVSFGLPGSATAALRPFLTVTYSAGSSSRPRVYFAPRQLGIRR